jgi:hypothetical protein
MEIVVFFEGIKERGPICEIAYIIMNILVYGYIIIIIIIIIATKCCAIH